MQSHSIILTPGGRRVLLLCVPYVEHRPGQPHGIPRLGGAGGAHDERFAARNGVDEEGRRRKAFDERLIPEQSPGLRRTALRGKLGVVREHPIIVRHGEPFVLDDLLGSRTRLHQPTVCVVGRRCGNTG